MAHVEIAAESQGSVCWGEAVGGGGGHFSFVAATGAKESIVEQFVGTFVVFSPLFIFEARVVFDISAGPLWGHTAVGARSWLFQSSVNRSSHSSGV